MHFFPIKKIAFEIIIPFYGNSNIHGNIKLKFSNNQVMKITEYFIMHFCPLHNVVFHDKKLHLKL